MSAQKDRVAFSDACIAKMFTSGKTVIDIGGGLRIDERNNRGNRNEKQAAFIRESGAEYKILDKVANYHPDIVGDVHDLPLQNDSVDGIICISLLEHVENPLQAADEIYRVLKPGGYLYLYVPFLYYYHPMPGYYKDFYRFTRDGIEYLTRNFEHVTIRNHRGAVATVMNLFPFVTKRPWMARFLFNIVDDVSGKSLSNQTAGYVAFCQK